MFKGVRTIVHLPDADISCCGSRVHVGFPRNGSQFHCISWEWNGTGKKVKGGSRTGIIDKFLNSNMQL